MSVLLVIPARYASSRFPGKPLVPLRGADGVAKSLIQRSWETACAVPGVDRTVVATDDDGIAAAAQGFGAEVVMTSADCANGTERCADVLHRTDTAAEIVVNLQGDAPLTPPWFVTALIAALRADPEIAVATPVLRCTDEVAADLRADRAAGRVGGTTAVFGADGRALYFSKEVLPFGGAPVFHHVGVYGYRAAALLAYPGWEATPLERSEGLEQLRFVERGAPVQCVEVDGRGRAFWEVNNPEDVPKVERHLAELGIS